MYSAQHQACRACISNNGEWAHGFLSPMAKSAIVAPKWAGIGGKRLLFDR
jgi:hypothetical protein